MIFRYKDFSPKVDTTAFIAESATVIGNVEIGAYTTVLFNAVIRGDEGLIKIGKRCNIQENVMCHLYEQYPLVLEDEVSLGHHAIVHGCTLKQGVLIGMGATVLDGAEIGEYSIVGAGSVVPPGKVIPPRSLVLGSPGKVVREVTEQDLAMIEETVETYVRNGQEFKRSDVLERIR
ncbi:gamma carbonic anhydrase family protein [Halalkalibacterium halodurans]|uniref:gamma carbonic anhydrase family protein n=1 Tax=Halalkalibacterium halodurans TaxID=86665 RepID=UPI002AA9991D|nr:gamma carbonic anhydrase family protein [Halalkalibacterium halodurans]MDY7220719.1 gamma carbonic anhydrase family protein [Halalkalibacterium halodurans]MDY7239958.1 gamma carbonic anhydrase family protein [Halalkalibacterium halodurans]MED4125894.1 gamma carbonic anhydrase family protein [Halalkalibacterium halodurans]